MAYHTTPPLECRSTLLQIRPDKFNEDPRTAVLAQKFLLFTKDPITCFKLYIVFLSHCWRICLIWFYRKELRIGEREIWTHSEKILKSLYFLLYFIYVVYSYFNYVLRDYVWLILLLELGFIKDFFMNC